MKDVEYKKIKLRNVFKYIIFLFPMFMPKIFTQYSYSSKIFSILNVVLFLFLMFTNVKNKKFKTDKIMLLWIGFRIYLFAMMIINRDFSNVLQWGYLSLMVLNLILLFKNTSNKKELIVAIIVLGDILLLINYISLLKYPRGIIRGQFFDNSDSDLYFLGIKTQFTCYMFAPLAASVYLMKNKICSERKRNAYLLTTIAICLLNVFNKHIGTAFTGIVIYIILLALSKIFKLKYNYKLLIFISIILTFFVIFFNIQNWFSVFIVNVLHKDISLSSRRYIWENAKRTIIDSGLFHILFGHGQHENFVPLNNTYWQPHNQLLSLVYNGGILGTYMFYKLLFLFGTSDNTNKIDKKKMNSNLSLLILLFCILTMSITEVYFDVAIVFIPFLILKYCVGEEYE